MVSAPQRPSIIFSTKIITTTTQLYQQSFVSMISQIRINLFRHHSASCIYISNLLIKNADPTTAINDMNLTTNMDLLEHLKVLRVAMPVRQKSPERQSRLPIFKDVKNLAKKNIANDGIFSGMSFCIPMLDPYNDPPNDKLKDTIIGIFTQGGQILQFDDKMHETEAKLVIVSEKTDIEMVRHRLRGLVKYERMIKYEFILDSLKKLKKMNPNDYLIYDNTNNQQITSAEIAKSKLEAELINSALIRPKLSENANETTENSMNQTLPRKNEENVEKDIDESLSKQHKSKQQEQETPKPYSQVVIYKLTEQSPLAETTRQSQNIFKTVSISKQIHKNDPINKQFMPQPPKYKRDAHKTDKSLQKPTKEVKPSPTKQQPEFKWQNKRDRRLVWYTLPEHFASHSFPRNDFICQKFMQLSEMYKRTGDTRQFNYVRAVAAIKSHPKEVNNIEDIREIQGLTHNMCEKAREVLETGSMSKMNKFKNNREIAVCKQLQKVWGIGPKKAKEFYIMGIKTVEDLRKRPDLISKNISVGLKYFQQFSKRIPRDKITRIFQQVKEVFYSQVLSDQMHQIQVVGSYRRGKATCGDIDILICRHDGSVERNLLQNLVAALTRKKIITESLSQPRPFDGHNNSCYMGVCFFEGQHHRIDIKHYPLDQYAFAVLYFTGSDLFNRSMRVGAHNKGLMLSDHGLKPKERNGQQKIWKGGSIPLLTTEQAIFKFLQMDYCTPGERQI